MQTTTPDFKEKLDKLLIKKLGETDMNCDATDSGTQSGSDYAPHVSGSDTGESLSADHDTSDDAPQCYREGANIPLLPLLKSAIARNNYNDVYNNMQDMRANGVTTCEILRVISSIGTSCECPRLWRMCMIYDSYCCSNPTTAQKIVQAFEDGICTKDYWRICKELAQIIIPEMFGKDGLEQSEYDRCFAASLYNAQLYSPVLCANMYAIIAHDYTARKKFSQVLAIASSPIGCVMQHIRNKR